MEVLAYEHFTGGASSGALPETLKAEGELMLRAMLDDLAAVPGVAASVLIDPRLEPDLPRNVKRLPLTGPFWPAFRRAVHQAQAVWLVAPEQGGVLARLTAAVLEGARVVLGSRLEAIRLAASKRATAQVLEDAGIPSVPVYPSLRLVPDSIEEIVAKPDDGAGCQDTWLFSSRAALESWIGTGRPPLVFQPRVRGEAMSLSALFCEGKARLLSCNRQQVMAHGSRFEFHGVTVNARQDHDGRYGDLVAGIARAVPGLWGYAGIDFIETDRGPMVLEINPRLTTSYAGLRRALGVNTARLVLELPESLDPSFAPISRPGEAVTLEVAHAV